MLAVFHDLKMYWLFWVMIHYYRDGTDYIPSHSDDDQYIDAKSYILSLSFGQTRNFIIRRKTDNVINFSAYVKR